jgi:hypothetical protein
MIIFHRFLITTAIVFCAGFAVWAFAAFRSAGGITALALAVGFAAAAGALSYYLKNLNRFLHR